MDTAIVLMCLFFIIIAFGLLVVFIVVYLNDTSHKGKCADIPAYYTNDLKTLAVPKGEVQDSYYSAGYSARLYTAKDAERGIFRNFRSGKTAVYGWYLEFYDIDTGQVFTKSFTDQITLGRDTGSEELFWQMHVSYDYTISRKQCVIYDCGGALAIENKSSVNVTMLNGYPVVTPYRLDERCLIGMGRHRYFVSKIQQMPVAAGMQA